MEFIESLREYTLVSILVRIVLATLFSGIIGLERDHSGKAAGMRTHILVCLGSTLAALVGLYVTDVLGYATDPMRISAQVISGIGFLGAGTILVRRHSQEITGLTTAAGLWSTAAIGLAFGVGFYEGAIICFIIIFGVFVIPSRYKKTYGTILIYYEINDVNRINEIFEKISDSFNVIDYNVRPPKSATNGYVGIEMNIKRTKYDDLSDIKQNLLSIDNIVFVYEEHK